MERDILDSLDDLGYDGKLKEEAVLKESLDANSITAEFSKCVSWLTTELVTHSGISENVNSIQDESEVEGFIMELSGFLREYGCPLPSLAEGPLGDRFKSRTDRSLLLDFLSTELESARITSVKYPELASRFKAVSLQQAPPTPTEDKHTQVANIMKTLMVGLGIPKPPANVTLAVIFQKIESTIQNKLSLLKSGLGKPLLNKSLSERNWLELEFIAQALRQDYEYRRRMTLNRLDVTIESFTWSDRVKNKRDQVADAFTKCRRRMNGESKTSIAHLLSAREDILLIEKTNSDSVREKSKCSINRVRMGEVPDRGGRAYELERPPPEMPAFQKRQAGPPGGGGGRGGGHRGGGQHQGGDRGHHHQGGHHQQGGYNQGGDRGYNQQGGHHQQGGYNQGGYNQQHGYDQGGYNQQGGYQGDYNQGGYGQQGGYGGKGGGRGGGGYHGGDGHRGRGGGGGGGGGWSRGGNRRGGGNFNQQQSNNFFNTH